MKLIFPSFSAIGSGRMGQFCPETQNYTNDFAVFDRFGIVKYKIFGASGGFWTATRNLPCIRWGGGGVTAPQTPAGLGNDLRSMHRLGQHVFSYTSWQGPMIFAEL